MSFEKALLDKVKKIEALLVSNFGASGKGLHEKLSSVENLLDSHLVRKIRRVATIRNKLFHEENYTFDQDQNVLFLDCDYIIEYLTITIKNQSSSSTQKVVDYDKADSQPLLFSTTGEQVVPLNDINVNEEETVVRSRISEQNSLDSMSTNSMYCHILHDKIGIITDSEGKTRGVICPQFLDENHMCKLKVLHMTKNGGKFVVSIKALITTFSDRFLGTKWVHCEFAKPRNRFIEVFDGIKEWDEY